ncbi:metallophosphoesterase family protein [Flavobacterium capsici]|uniref:Metallophosphoesterase family protein n=1 Tax=Flavobacterium capsici TaxID=3075618 RepID=A0AA96EYU3_9FLAO|nr:MULTISPECIES: metallophosphoesterase family protein [unclassified Flavobacterium]WNM19590.1 metallophosphoesterase family protein [Flavobacterium sp. PMR2A8]WNM20979.1 metallophosphoesterase family protein [Flavobacterium sp. PMTSA4]
MNRILVIGDIHGGLHALHQIMERANVTKNDTLIFLGDYVDGWSQSPEVIDYLIELGEKQNCIFINGNHDELLLEWLSESEDNLDWYRHGGESTVLAYRNVSSETKREHIAFLQSLKPYYLDDKKRLFIHAGFTNLNGIDYEYFPKLFSWDRTLWETALALDDSISKESEFYPKRFKHYHEIYIGHTPVTRINKTVPIQKANVWNIDTGAAFKGPLTIMDIETKEYWQSEPVFTLYPFEKGRN